MARTALPQDTLLLGRYSIERMIGSGGFGITYAGRDVRLNRTVAIKEYFPNEFATRDGSLTVNAADDYQTETFELGRRWFLAEARTLAGYSHPNIVGVLDHFEENGTAYMVLVFERGLQLAKWLANLRRPPNQAEIDSVLVPILSALETMHSNHDLHRDVALDNIILRPDGTPALIDFGSARKLIGSHSRTMAAVIKSGYSPMEQYTSEVEWQGPWSDIYALAASMHLALTGKLPPDGPGRHLKETYQPLAGSDRPDYRRGLLEGIDWGLAIEPENRPQSIAEWRPVLMRPDTGIPIDASADNLTRPTTTRSTSTGGSPQTGPNATGPSAPAPAPAALVDAPRSRPATQRLTESVVTGLGAVTTAIANRRNAGMFDAATLTLAAGGVGGFIASGGIQNAMGAAFLGIFPIALLAYCALGWARPDRRMDAVRALIALGILWLPGIVTAVISVALFGLAYLVKSSAKPWQAPALTAVGGGHILLGLWFLVTPATGSLAFTRIAVASLISLGLVAILAAPKLTPAT